MGEAYVSEEFPWVVLAQWADSGPTVHGGYRTAEAAERSAAAAWRDVARCTGWTVLLMSDPPVGRP